HCTVCHSAKNLNELDVSGGLALDSYQAVLKGSTRTVIKPGKSDESKLLKLVMSTDPDKRMPLGAMPLAAENIDLLRRWIDAGAKEGQAPASVEVATTSASPVRVRKLDITLPTSTVPPAGALGPGKPAKLELALKVGPLAPVAALAF